MASPPSPCDSSSSIDVRYEMRQDLPLFSFLSQTPDIGEEDDTALRNLLRDYNPNNLENTDVWMTLKTFNVFSESDVANWTSKECLNWAQGVCSEYGIQADLLEQTAFRTLTGHDLVKYTDSDFCGLLGVSLGRKLFGKLQEQMQQNPPDDHVVEWQYHGAQTPSQDRSSPPTYHEMQTATTCRRMENTGDYESPRVDDSYWMMQDSWFLESKDEGSQMTEDVKKFDSSSTYDSSGKMQDSGDSKSPIRAFEHHHRIETEDDMCYYSNTSSPFRSSESDQPTSLYSSSSSSPCPSSSPSPPLTGVPSTYHHPQSSPLSQYRSSLLSTALEPISITDYGLERGDLESLSESDKMVLRFALRKIKVKGRNREREPKNVEFLCRLHCCSMLEIGDTELVRWEDENAYRFRLVETNLIARMWGMRRRLFGSRIKKESVEDLSDEDEWTPREKDKPKQQQGRRRRTSGGGVAKYKNYDHSISAAPARRMMTTRCRRRSEGEDLTYENFARGLRYHYKKNGFINAVSERQLVYQWSPQAIHFMQSESTFLREYFLKRR